MVKSKDSKIARAFPLISTVCLLHYCPGRDPRELPVTPLQPILMVT